MRSGQPRTSWWLGSMTPDRPDTETGEETRTEASGEKGRNAAAQEALVLSWDSQRGDTDIRTQCTTGTSLSLRGLCRHVLSGTWHVPDGIWFLAGWQTGCMVRLICTYKIHPSEKHTSGLKTAHLSRTETLIWAIHRKLVIYVRAKNEKGKARFMSTG